MPVISPGHFRVTVYYPFAIVSITAVTVSVDPGLILWRAFVFPPLPPHQLEFKSWHGFSPYKIQIYFPITHFFSSLLFPLLCASFFLPLLFFGPPLISTSPFPLFFLSPCFPFFLPRSAAFFLSFLPLFYSPDFFLLFPLFFFFISRP